MTMRAMTIFFALLIAGSALCAAPLSDFYILPVAAHTTGVGGTAWRTDVTIQNVQQTPLTVSVAVVESGEGLLDNIVPVSLNGSATATVPAGGSATLSDILQNHRGRAETSGALLVGGDQPFVLVSRTYEAAHGAGTVGETVLPAGEAAPGGTLYVPALVSNATSRSNIGLFAAAGAEPLVVEVSLRDEGGRVLGTRSFTIAPGAATHVQFSARSVAAAPFDGGAATVRIASGDGSIIAYGSVVDNASEDASFIPGGFTSAGTAPSLEALLPRDR
jgi:hypothetical protein